METNFPITKQQRNCVASKLNPWKKKKNEEIRRVKTRIIDNAAAIKSRDGAFVIPYLANTKTRKLGEYQWRRSQQFAEGRRLIRLMLGTRGQRGSKRASPFSFVTNARKRGAGGVPFNEVEARSAFLSPGGPILTRLPRENGGEKEEGESS